MAGTRITQLEPHATPARRYGTFAGKAHAAHHPVGRLTQESPAATSARRYGVFTGKASSGSPHPVERLTQLCPVATAGRRYGVFTGKPAGGVTPPIVVGRFVRPVVREPRQARHYRYTATGGLELGGAATVAYRRAPARHYTETTTGGLLLGGVAGMHYRPALTRAHVVMVGGLELGGSAEVRHHDHLRDVIQPNDLVASALLGLAEADNPFALLVD